MVMRRSRESDREYVYNSIKELIINGEIAPGERIMEVACAEMLNVSRTPVREAILMLQRDGLVEVKPKCGAHARRIPSDEVIEQIYSMRKVIQVAFVERIIEHVGVRLEILEKCNRECQAALERDDIVTFYANYDLSNRTLCESISAPVVLTVLELLDNFEPYTAFSTGNEIRSQMERSENVRIGHGRRAEALNEHIQITDAIRKKDVEGLKDILSIHIDNAKTACISGIGKLRKEMKEKKK